MKHSHFLKTILLLIAITFAQKATYAQSVYPLQPRSVEFSTDLLF